MFSDLLEEHGCLDILVPHESHVKFAEEAARHEGYRFPDADVRIIVDDQTDIDGYLEREGRPVVWYWHSNGQRMNYPPRPTRRARPRVRHLPRGKVRRVSELPMGKRRQT